MLHCKISFGSYVQRTMSKQLSVSAAAAVFAMSAVALLSPGSAHPSDALDKAGALSVAAPMVSVDLFSN